MGIIHMKHPHHFRANREEFLKKLNQNSEQWYGEKEPEYLRKTSQNAKKYYKRKNGFER